MKITYTRGTPFYESELTPGEFLIAFILYADTLLSITQIAGLLSSCYTTLHDHLREFETAFCRGFPTVWERISQTVDGPTQVDETQQVCSGYKRQDPPRKGLDRGGSPEGGRTRWTGDQGDELTLVAACRDVLRVVSAQEGSDYEEDLGPVIEDGTDPLFEWEPTEVRIVRDGPTVDRLIHGTEVIDAATWQREGIAFVRSTDDFHHERGVADGSRKRPPADEVGMLVESIWTDLVRHAAVRWIKSIKTTAGRRNPEGSTAVSPPHRDRCKSLGNCGGGPA